MPDHPVVCPAWREGEAVRQRYAKFSRTRRPQRYFEASALESCCSHRRQITSRYDGVIKKLYYEEDDTAEVGKVWRLGVLRSLS